MCEQPSAALVITIVSGCIYLILKIFKIFNMDWINIQKQLPPFGERVLFRVITTWNTRQPIDFFDDELTMAEETLEYGQSAYVLNNHCDWLVSQHPNINELCDQYVTHWCRIPESFS